jgi:serine/threonine-protein kinase
MHDVLRERLQSTLGAAYTLERELGGGGMSRVFVAEDAALGRRIVVKVLAPELAEGLSAERFAREIRLAARLQHPNVVPVHAAGAGPDGLPYYTMPYIDGASLRERLAAGPLPVSEALAVLRDVARALAYAHAQGVVHRDIKPENVLITGGAAVVADFGIAKALRAAGLSGSATLTQVGMAVGTPAYMAPEQAVGQDDVDHRADLYAWGLLAWEALAGRHPFTERTTPMALIGAQLTQTPSPLGVVRPVVPPALAALVARCLAKDPAARPADAGEVLRALDAVALTPAEPVAAPASPAATPTLAVLPMANVGGDPEHEHFSDGLTDELIGALSTVASLRVTGRTSSFALKGKGLGVAEAARTLGVASVLEGSVRRAGSRMKARLQLVDADGTVRWAEAFDRTVDDIFAVQEEIAQAVVRALAARLAGERGPLVRPPTADPVAYDLYLRGRSFFRSGHAEASRQAITLWEQAVARDPGFAAAHAALAWTFAMMPIVTDLPARDFAPRARTHARRALELDERLAEAHAAMANVAYAADLDVPAAGAHVRRALELDPGSVEAHLFHAVWLKGQRHFARAEAHARRAVEIDPLMPNAHFVLAWVHQASGRPAEALPRLTTVTESTPGWAFPREMLVLTHVALGRLDEALAECRRALEVGSRRERALLAYVHALRGERAEAQAILEALQTPAERPHAPPCQMAYAYAALGDPDAAIGWIERAFDERDPHVNGLGDHLPYDPLRADPRFRALLSRLRHAPPPDDEPVPAPPDAHAPAPHPPDHSLVVLPFANLSPDPDTGYFSDGLTEELIADLARVRALRVISRTSAMRYRGRERALRDVAAELGVRYVLEGSVRRAGAQLRITARLVDAKTDAQLWADKFAGTLDDVFDLQERVSRDVVQALDVTLSADEDRRFGERPVADAAAYDCWLRARHEIARASDDSLAHAAVLLRRGLDIVPGNARLRGALAATEVVAMRARGETDVGLLARVAAEADEVYAEAPGAGGAHSLLGFLAFERGEMQAAATHYARAVAADPQDSEAGAWLGIVYLYVGHTDDARRLLDRLRRDDPLYLWPHGLASVVDWFEGRPGAGVAAMERCLALGADGPIWRWHWGYLLALLGRHAELTAEAGRLAEREPDHPYVRHLLAMAAILGGTPDAARPHLAALAVMPLDAHLTFHVGECHALLGDAERALALVESAGGRGFHPAAFIARHDPFLAGVRADPRFAAVAAEAERRRRAFVV